MGFAEKTTQTSNQSSATPTTDNRIMGFLLVFFPQDNSNSKSNSILRDPSPSSSSPSSSPVFRPNPTAKLIRRTNSSGFLLTKAQSTISICVLFLLLTLFVFTISTFEPTIPINPTTKPPRRFLSDYPLKSPPTSSFLLRMWNRNPRGRPQESVDNRAQFFALQGMGTLYRRGTKAMNDLLVCHVVEDVDEDEMRLFLRLLHRSGVTAKSDVVLIFGSSSAASRFDSVVQEESESFLSLVQAYQQSNFTNRNSALSFDLAQFVKPVKKEVGEPIWGRRSRGNYSGNSAEEVDESPRLNYGSVIGFESNELDSENSLAGFLDHVPTSLRRWACYPMLLGRVRRNFKHIMLVDVKNSLLLSDPLGRVRNHSPESVHVWLKQDVGSSKHGKKSAERTQSSRHVNSAIVMGGARGVRRLSNAMLTEIVRAALQHKKNQVTESGVLSQLVGNEHITKGINIITRSELIPETSSITGLDSNYSRGDYAIIHSGNRHHNYMVMKQLCLSEAESSVYRDC